MWNLIFTSCFTVELVLKLIGYGVEEYFQDNWNCFDFVLVSATPMCNCRPMMILTRCVVVDRGLSCGCCHGVVCEHGSVPDIASISCCSAASFDQFQRRCCHFVENSVAVHPSSAECCRTLITFIHVVSGLSPLCALPFCFIASHISVRSYAVLGVSLFGELPRGDVLIEHNNFENCTHE